MLDLLDFFPTKARARTLANEAHWLASQSSYAKNALVNGERLLEGNLIL